ERPDDIPLLARVFAAEVSAQLGRAVPDLDPEAVGRLRAYAWPGNVRELRSVIERALVLHPGRGLAALDLAPEPVRSRPPEAEAAAGKAPGPDDLGLRDNLDRLERSLILEAHR